MSFIEALLLSLALCVDSLVVSTTTSFRSKMNYSRGLLMAVVFGICQGGFPLLGALIGDVARAFIESVDHWVAFGLLAVVGGKMIWEALSPSPDKEENGKHTDTLIQFLLLGVATSIDAFAVGIGLGLDNPMSTVLWVVLMIGSVTFIVSMTGVYLGKRNIPVPEKTATLIAGLVLIALGVKILFEHLL